MLARLTSTNCQTLTGKTSRVVCFQFPVYSSQAEAPDGLLGEQHKLCRSAGQLLRVTYILHSLLPLTAVWAGH